MKYENIREYADEKFRRITGVKRTTFEKMLEILRPAKEKLSAYSRMFSYFIALTSPQQ